jgi:hypothetical protein
MNPQLKFGLSLSGSPVLFVLLLFICTGSVIWLYRRTVPVIPPIIKVFLIILRSAALTGLVFLIFSPIVRIVYHQTKLPAIGVLIDNSGSMRLSDQEIRRSDTVYKLMQSPEMALLSSQTDMRAFLFSNTLFPLNGFPPDSIPFSGTSTDIARALTDVSKETGGTELKGLLLISDGSYNHGENPVRIGSALGIPVSSIQIGEPDDQRDLILTRMITNEIVYTEDRIPVEISVRGSGYSGRQAIVVLTQETEVVDQKSIIIPSDGMEIAFQLFYTPHHAGYVNIAAEISRFEGEITYENNRQVFYAKALDNKLQVLLLSGAPHPDLSFINRLLSQDENIHVLNRTQKMNAQFYEGPFLSETELQTIDVFILLNFPARSTDMQIWNKIVAVIQNSQKPFLLIAGKQTEMNRLQSIQTVLPFQLPRRIPDRLVLPRLSQQGAASPVLRIDENNQFNQNTWHQLPPVFLNWQSPGQTEGCHVLAFGVPENASLPGGVSYPMVFVGDIGNRKTLAVLASDLYRWDLIVRGLGEDPVVLRGFLMNSIRWLSTREEGKYVRTGTNKPVFTPGETVFLSTHVYNETYRPLEKARVTAKLVSPSTESSFQLIDSGEGLYEYAFQIFESGMYRVLVGADLEGRTIGGDTTSFSVSSFNPEFLSTKANPEILQKLADNSGGKSGPPDSLRSVIQNLIFPPETVLSTDEIELFNLPWTLGFLMVLLCSEWFIRKRKGML